MAFNVIYFCKDIKMLLMITRSNKADGFLKQELTSYNFLNVRAKLKLPRTRLIKSTSKMAITLPPIIELKTFNVKSTSEI